MTFKDYKIKDKKGLLGGHNFEVHEVEYLSGKPVKELNSIKLFGGSITECESYLNLLKKDDISR